MQTEISALEQNRTWDITSLPPEKNVIGCKWVYKIKHKSDGSIERRKANLVGATVNKKGWIILRLLLQL